MEWYKRLDINTKINVKDCFVLACGAEFGQLGFLLTLPERIDIMYMKLKKIGFDL